VDSVSPQEKKKKNSQANNQKQDLHVQDQSVSQASSQQKAKLCLLLAQLILQP
jgi:hypothetical protein